MLYEQRKHDGSLPIIGVNTFRNPRRRRRPATDRAGPRDRGGEAVASSTGCATSRPRHRRRGAPRRSRGCRQAAHRRRQRVRRADGRRPRAARSGRSPRRSSRSAASTGATCERPAPGGVTSTAIGDQRLPFDPIARGRRRPVGRRAAGTRRRRRDGGGHLGDARAPDHAGPGRRGAASARADVRPLRDAHAAAVLAAPGRCRCPRSASRLQVHPASVTNVVDRLEAQGLVRRRAAPQRPAGRRSPRSPTAGRASWPARRRRR